MALTLDDCIEGVAASRQFFLKHMVGVTDQQLDWKPYPECKSIRETLAHLIEDDRASKLILETGAFPDFESIRELETDVDALKSLLVESNRELCEFLRTKFADSPLDLEVSFFKGPQKLAQTIADCSAEDYYHAGQVAFIRIATDPGWDYYRAVYNLG